VKNCAIIARLLGIAVSFSLASAWLDSSIASTRSKQDLEKEYRAGSYRAVGRDAFPVLHNPTMGSVTDGDRVLRPNEWVIGFAFNGEARAYPITVMGFHELINDRVGGLSITVCW
jgi:hypothetical protein